MPGADVAIRLLGPVEVWRGDSAVPAGGPTQRAVLAMLALRAPEPIPVDALAEGIWGESDEPLGGDKATRVHVSRLRAILHGLGAGDALETVSGGYRLKTHGVTVDTVSFERLLAEGRRRLLDGDPEAATASLAAALALWRGPALMDVRDFPFAVQVAQRYDELRVDAAEERFEASLAAGEHQSLVPELKALVAEHPYRERLHRLLMLALYRAGQQAAALEAFQSARARLVLDLGVEPGPELSQLQQQILMQSAELESPSSHAAARPVDTGPGPRPPRLPAAPHLIGRDELLDELVRLCQEERLVTLIGAGGSGKTVLGLALLHRLAPRYADGAAFVDLAAVTRPDQVLPALAVALGVTQGGGSLAERLADVLAERRMLVLLDNLEHLLEAVPEIGTIVARQAGLMIATSRTPLGLHAEYVVLVPPLPAPASRTHDLRSEPSVQLFLRAAAAGGSRLTVEADGLAAIGEICRAVDGLPLAIEIMAAQTRVHDVSDLAAHLTERLPDLRARARDAPDRQRTMEGAIRWSYDRLPADRRQAFCTLAVFAGSFDARGAAAVMGCDLVEAIATLADLLDASLIVRQPSLAGHARFRMLEPIRSVATSLADGVSLRKAVDRHVEFVTGEIDRLCPRSAGIRRPEDLAYLRAEHPNLSTTLGVLARDAAERCVDLLVQLDDYWIWTGGEVGAIHLIDELLAAGQLSDRGRCEALTLRLSFETRVGFGDGASAALEEALTLARGLADDATRGRARLAEAWWAVLALGSNGQARARRAIREAMSHARRSEDAKLLAESLAFAAWLQSRAGNPERDTDRVREWLDEGLAIVRDASMAHAETLMLRALTNYHGTLRNDPHAAAEAARAALEIARRFDSPERATWYAINVGVFAVLAGSIEEGRIVFLSALRTDDRIGHRLAALYHIINLALVESTTGRWRNALVLYAASAAVARTIGAGFLLALDPEDEAAYRAAAEHVGPAGATEARAVGERMSYREVVDFAFAINGVAVD